jgi:hypothetical protein
MWVLIKFKAWLIFIDEVSFNPRHVKFYSWVPKKNPDLVI